jgi:orotate phosphoribosyltransferase
VSGLMALVDREEGGRQAIEKTGVAVVSLVTASEIIAALTTS